MKKVEGHNGLYRNDIGAIINTDNESYMLYKQKREKVKLKDDKFKSMENDLKDTKEELSEIKRLLKELLRK